MTEWLDLENAIELIRSARKIGVGAATQLLVEACAEGVATRQRPCYLPDYWLTIPAGEWRGAHLDLGTGELFPAGTSPHNPPTAEGGYGDGGNGIIEVNEADLREWLGRPAKPESGKRARVRPQRDLADRAIAAVWPNGVPSQGALPNKRLVEKVMNHLRENDVAVSVSSHTVLRAAGRKGN